MTEPSPANAVYYKKKEKHSNTKDDFKKNHEYEQKEREKKAASLICIMNEANQGNVVVFRASFTCASQNHC